MIGNIATFLNLFYKTLPETYTEFAKFKYTMNTSIEHLVFDDIYQQIQAADFSREILQKNPEALQVLPVKNLGWNDLGKPQRVFQTLNKLDSMPYWVKAAW